jgi:excisionase family DNA binding protein
MSAMKPTYLRPKEAAAYMAVGLTKLYALIGSKKLKTSMIGGVRLIRVEDIDALVNSSLQ